MLAASAFMSRNVLSFRFAWRSEAEEDGDKASFANVVKQKRVRETEWAGIATAFGPVDAGGSSHVRDGCMSASACRR